MKNLSKLAGFGIATLAAASFALVSTSADAAAAHHAAAKNVKCAGVVNSKGKELGVIQVSKAVCDQLGGTVKVASAKTAPKVSSAAPAAQATTAAANTQVTGAQTAAATTTTAATGGNADQNQQFDSVLKNLAC